MYTGLSAPPADAVGTEDEATITMLHEAKTLTMVDGSAIPSEVWANTIIAYMQADTLGMCMVAGGLVFRSVGKVM